MPIFKKYLNLFPVTLLALVLGAAWLPGRVASQPDTGPEVLQTFGQGLPRDGKTLLFADDQYPTWPLTPEQQRYASIDGARMKQQVVDLGQIALRYRDAGHRWWGRLPGTSADREGMAYMTERFEQLGLSVERFPYRLPMDWRPQDWQASFTSEDGMTVALPTAFPVAGTRETGPEGLAAEAVWVGVGSAADFSGRDVAGKAVVIYSVFVPGGRSHSASDRSGLFNANTRAVERGAAMVINVMGVPGNGQFQPEGGIEEIPQFTLSMDDGFVLRERLDRGEKVMVRFRLQVERVENVETAYTIATLPGSSDEEIVIMTHTDGYFQAATDNAAGMASALEIARFYAGQPLAERPRTLRFIQFSDHHHGEVARGRPGIGINDAYPWERVALKLTMEHPSQTLLYMYNNNLTPTNGIGAFRWNSLGSPVFEQMVFDTLKEFGVSVYAIEDGPKNGAYAPSFHIIDHVIYHTSLDIPELVPASGLERSTRAFAAIIDRVNTMSLAELRGDGFPPADRRGTLKGTQRISGR
ncbi:MAG: M28 family peptidase [Gammaproteobacteria bacterium]|nr:M28 family peptidase [Pseudomonadales bacterium]MCP5347461.1 M28 family peptidase [Pseudomonadales bacterium]